jgi:hypothetical protein
MKLLALLAFTTVASAQSITLINNSPTPYEGYKRIYLNTPPPYLSGWKVESFGSISMTGMYNLPVLTYSIANLSQNGWAVDLFVRLNASELRVVDLSTLDVVVQPVPVLPADLGNYFTGLPSCNGTTLWPMELVLGYFNLPTQIHDGAGHTSVLAANINSNLAARLTMTWYANQPGWCQAEMRVRAYNDYMTPNTGINLSWTGASIMRYNGPMGEIVPPNTKLVRGQERKVPLTIVWWNNIPNWQSNSAMADVNYQVIARPND